MSHSTQVGRLRLCAKGRERGHLSRASDVWSDAAQQALLWVKKCPKMLQSSVETMSSVWHLK